MQFGLSHPPLMVFDRHDQTSLIINGVQTTLVFDVYGSKVSTKQTEQRIRAGRCTWSDMQYVTTTPEATFYANICSKKKQRLVSKRMLNGGHLCHLGCSQQMPIDCLAQPTLHYSRKGRWTTSCGNGHRKWLTFNVDKPKAKFRNKNLHHYEILYKSWDSVKS